MMLELVGLGLIIPFIKSLMLEGTDTTISTYLNKINLFPKNKNELILIFITLISMIYTIKTIYLTFFPMLRQNYWLILE